MPGIISKYNELKKSNDAVEEQSPEPEVQSHAQSLYDNNQEEAEKPKVLPGPGGISNDPERVKNNQDAAVTEDLLGGGTSQPQKDLRADEDSWSADYTAKGFLEESGTSVMRGIGNHLLKGTGDMIQVAWGLGGGDIRGNMFSSMMQDAGGEMAEKYKAMIPEELQHENITFSSAFDPKFWSIHVAEMIPQLAEFILLSKGGSAIARKGAGSLLKKLPGATKIANGTEVFGSGSGIVGKLATEQGLSAAGSMGIGAVGGGVASNLFSGLLNASQLVNENKDSGMYSEEELSQLAASSMRNNTAWLAMDIASYGLTFGGGWKALKGMNPVGKGGKLYTAAQQSKTIGKLFQYDVAPILKGIARVSKKAAFEGTEEMFQETFEEWASKKAMADQTGFFSEDLFDVPSYWDFMKSKENRATLALSAAVGGLAGGGFNISSLVNQKADDSYRLINRTKNLSEIVDKQGTDEELEWQEYHIRQTLADIVIDGRIELYDSFSNKIVENGNITEDEKSRFDEMLLEFQEVKQKGKKLNVKGLSALMYNKAKQSFVEEKMQRYEDDYKNKIETYKSLENIDEKKKLAKIRQAEAEFEKQYKAASILRAEAIQNQENLIIGEKANPLNIEISVDENNNEMLVGGLSSQQFNEFTEEGSKNPKKQSLKENIKDKVPSFKVPSMSNLTKKGREMVDNMMSRFKKTEEEAAPVAEEKKPEAAPVADEVNEVTPESQEKANVEAGQIIEDSTIDDESEPISDEVYGKFEKQNSVDQKTIDDIAQSVYEKGTLSERQDEIRVKNPEAVQRAITRLILGTKGETSNESDEFASERPSDSEEKSLADKLKEKAKQTIDDAKSKMNDGSKVESSEDDDDTEDAEFEVVEDEDLSNEENDFVNAELSRKDKLKSIKNVAKNKLKTAAKNWNFNKDRSKTADADFDGMDARNETQTGKSIVRKNFIEHKFMQKLRNNLRMSKSRGTDQISQNQLDVYLNKYSTYNMVGPSEIDKMAMVNHHLKNMFPQMDSPVQVLVVSNLYSSIGSQGLGHALGATIFIDNKAWNQEKVYMHELSHIYYNLSKNEPHTQALIKKAMANKDLLERIKGLYDDYTLYDMVSNGQVQRVKKGDIIQSYLRSGLDKNLVRNAIKSELENGTLKSVPLSQQSLILEELFVAQLEGPLAQNFDKIFQPRQEPLRQESVKKWWGIIQKKSDVFRNEDGVSQMMEKLHGEEPTGVSLKDFVLNRFKAVTEGVEINAAGMDARVEAYSMEMQERMNDVADRKAHSLALDPVELDMLEEKDFMDDYEIDLEEQGVSFYNKDFNDKIKGASKLLKRFGAVYSKSLRSKFVQQNKSKNVDYAVQETFDKDLFESVLYNLAVENDNPNAFIVHIENSALKEVQAFNRFMDKIHPDRKLQLLNSMHFVFSNSKHVVGFRNILKENGDHQYVNSLSQKELSSVEDFIGNLRNSREAETPRWLAFKESVENVMAKKENKKDIQNILGLLVDPMRVNLDKIYDQGYITYQGVNMPIETLIGGYIRKGMMFQTNSNKNVINVYNTRKLIEAIVNTNRKFSPFSSVKNAEGNMEPVRIANNNMTKEVDSIIDFLQGDENGKPTKEQFLDRYSHLGHKSQNKNSGQYVPNQFLENIYDNFEKGILPTISQYHGIEDTANNNGSLFKNSTALEQSLEDLLTYNNTSQNSKGIKRSSFLGNMGSFSNSPRKFFMNMKRIDYSQVFEGSGANRKLKMDGKIINSIFNLHNQINNEDAVSNNKEEFKKQFKKSINDYVDFVKENADALSKVKSMKKYFNKDGTLNEQGETFASEFAMNSIVHGYNIVDTFLPGVKGDNVVKRFKMNSSPVFSVKNKNFKIEPLFFSDEITGNSISGTDSGMFILEEDAKNLQNLGRGVFEMNSGFKILNASIEKENPNFKGKAAYLKGYTTIVDSTHPLYPALKARKDKYKAYHMEKYGVAPSGDLADGTFNHLVIAIPQSSDKSGFSKKEMIKKNRNEETGETTLEYTEDGLKMTPGNIANHLEEMNKFQDDMFYSKKGEFMGIESYNFGPQQLMDKQTKSSNTPVQMINSIIVNAAINGKLDFAIGIQEDISKQKRANLEKVLKEIASKDMRSYKELIEKSLNKKDMDQAQRILIEDKGSLAHPYVNEIVVNQLAKTLRREGNKLVTPGTNAHQKPDIGFKVSGRVNNGLKGYQLNDDGTLSAGEIVLPSHMGRSVEVRKEFTISSMKEEIAAISRSNKKTYSKDEQLQVLKTMAERAAKSRSKKETGVDSNYKKFMSESKNEAGVVIGYTVKGEYVLASRVPGDGPSSTGVFEAVGFDSGNGNQVMVSSEFNDIIGADNDGDSLFVQTKGGSDYDNWNNAFKKITEYWLSKEMADQVTTQMNFEDETKEIVKKINKVFPKNEDYVFPFSPQQRAIDYNNTMVSNRNVGPVFNTHKIANMLAAYQVSMSKNIQINNSLYDGFKDEAVGQQSRNQRSAILANIVLDNASHGFADALGLDEHNITQAVLMVNLGISLEDVGMILNSPSAKAWSDLNRKNQSLYHKKMRPATVVRMVYKQMKIDPPSNRENVSLKIKTKLAAEKSQQTAIIELLSYLGTMNSEIQKVSAIMNGHSKIHVNPLVLEKQMKDFREVVFDKKSTTLKLNEDFKTNPDLQNYYSVAEKTLDHTKTLNPVYRYGTNEVLSNLNKKIGGEINEKEIETISKDLSKFITSRLLGLNNFSRAKAEELMNPSSKKSIFRKLDFYLTPLREDLTRDEKDLLNSVSKLESSLLFRKALNYNLHGNNQFISANSSFVNESFNETERERAQEEFEELPTELKDALILYDLIHHGWKGPQSMAPYFGKETNAMINMESNRDLTNKNKDISPVVKKELERIIALKHSRRQSNSFKKVYIRNKNANLDPTVKENMAVEEIFRNPEAVAQIEKGQPTYIVVKDQAGHTSLYEMDAISDAELGQIKTERSRGKQRERLLMIAKSKIHLVPNTLERLTGGAMDITLISDKNLPEPFKTSNNYEEKVNVDALTEATINYEDAARRAREKMNVTLNGMDARESYDEELFASKEPLNEVQFAKAMEFSKYATESFKKTAYKSYQAEKMRANEEAPKVLAQVEKASTEELLDMYTSYGDRDVYAYSIILTPIVKRLAGELAADQAQLFKDNNVEGKGFDGTDVSKIKAYLMTGSTIPSNHPHAQALARMIETEYKSFIKERSKYTSKLNDVSRRLYAANLGYSEQKSIGNTLRRIRDMFTSGTTEVYQKLYGNLVIREESISDKGVLTYNYKLKPEEEIARLHQAGRVSDVEKEFYDFFRKTTEELKPNNLKKEETDYIPHTSMSRLEAFSSRGLLGLMVNARPDEDAIYDVKIYHKNDAGEEVLMNFKQVEDLYKRDSASVHNKNNINKIMEYREAKKKALKLLKSGINEDKSKLIYSGIGTETALGFGAINRFANSRSVKSKEMPSMDLNKALGDYIHSTLFVNGNEGFKGMEKLQGYIDGVLAFNRENNLDNMNIHVQKVWKDYFLRGKRQESFMGKKADKVIRTLTKLNLFYALGYQANKNTGGLYALGNIAVGKYHNIKELGGKQWIRGEMKYWGLDEGFNGGIMKVIEKHKRMQKIMKNLNFMEINVYDEVNMEKKHGLDAVFSNLALSPMVHSEKWIQTVHMIGHLTDEEFNLFDAEGNYKPDSLQIQNERLVELEDKVKASHGRGYQPTDQRAVQMYSWGNMMLQFSKFLPTMLQDRFAKKDVNIYGREHIGSLRAVGDMVRYVANDPKGYLEYRGKLSDDDKKRLDSGLKGMAISTLVGMVGFGLQSESADDLFWDSNYYMNYGKLSNKIIPPAIQSTNNLLGGLF